MRAGSLSANVVVAMVAGLVMATAGCGSEAVESEAKWAAGMATTRGGAGGDELILPVNAYEFTVPERNRQGWARQILTSTCMRRLGYREDPAADEAQYNRVAAIDLADHGMYGNKRRYVLTDPVTASKYGYHLISTVTATLAPGRPSRQAADPMVMAEREALTGRSPNGDPVTHTAGGQRIPAGGCVGAADASLSDTGQVGEADPVSRLDAASYQHSLHDANVLAGFDAWSTCMTGRGYHLASPVHASDGFDLDTPTVTSAEIATAQADVACKQQTHLTDIWFQSEVTYQKTQISKKPDQFHQVKLDHDATMQEVNKVLAGDDAGKHS